MRKEIHIKKLAAALEKMVNILELDQSCQWTNAFRNNLEMTRSLQKKDASLRELSDLSSSIMYIFKGMGSFNDYSPSIFNSTTGTYIPIPGSEDFERISNEIYSLSLLIREKD